jgi:seryl-tRNA synthetase
VSAFSKAEFLPALLANGVLIDTGVPGLMGKGQVFEDVLAGLDARITRFSQQDQSDFLRFPPGMNRRVFDQTGYMKNFPQLAGCVHSFCGDNHDFKDLVKTVEAGGEYSTFQEPTEVVLTPAACYPYYPILASRGPMSEDGAEADMGSFCFRHESAEDPGRMQMFRVREFVRAGTPEQVLAFREKWLDRCKALMTELALPFHVDVASDPFFGRTGALLASSQREQQLKFEMLIEVSDPRGPTACASFNYHQEHFGDTFGIRTHDGQVAHTACVGFGMERTTLALLMHHGLTLKDWPEPVRRVLWN